MIGSALDFLDPDTFRDGIPFAALRELRAAEPVSFRAHADERGYWFLTRHHDISAALVDAKAYSSWRGATNMLDIPAERLEFARRILLNMDPPAHTRYRRLITKSVASRAVERLTPRLEMLSKRTIDRIAARGSCDFVADVASKLPMQVICELLGVPEADWERLYACSNTMMARDDPDFAGSKEDVSRASMEIFGYSAALADERRARPKEDLMSALIAAEVDGQKLAEGEINAFFVLLVIAGNETTRTLLAGGLHALLENPSARDRLLADPSLWPGAVEEMLRFVSPIMQWRRTLDRDVTLHGKELREGDKVIVSLISANRDERVFTDPESFDITRRHNPHVAFGFGPHLCLGATLARMEARLLLQELFRRLPDMALDGPIVRVRSNFINGIKRMPIRYTPG
jgi:cholest-4-en-3-one 26-monooxygenase